MSQVDEYVFITPRGIMETNKNSEFQGNSLYQQNQKNEIKLKFPISNNFINAQNQYNNQRQSINNKSNARTPLNQNSIQNTQGFKFSTQNFNTPSNTNTLFQNTGQSQFFVKQKLQEFQKQAQTKKAATFEKQKSIQILNRPVTAASQNTQKSSNPQWKVLEKHSQLEHMKDNYEKKVGNTLPVFQSQSLQRRISKIKIPQQERLLQESVMDHIEEYYEKSRVQRSSNYNQHRNAINGINKMIRPEQKVVTELRRNGVKSVDTIEKTLKRLSLVKEDQDAILKQNVNTNIVYDKLMLEYLKDQRNHDTKQKNSQKLLKFQRDNHYKITCFSIPNQKPQPQMFNITTKSLRDLNQRFLQVDPQFVTKKKKKQMQQQKLKSQKHVFSDLYNDEQKKIIKMQQEGVLDIEEYILTHDPVMQIDDKKARKILLQAFPPKKKGQNKDKDNDNDSTDSEPYWYRQLQWEKQQEQAQHSESEDENEEEENKQQQQNQQIQNNNNNQ